MSFLSALGPIAETLLSAGAEAATVASDHGMATINLFGHEISVAGLGKDLQTLAGKGPNLLDEFKSGDPAQEAAAAATVLSIASVFASGLVLPAAAAAGVATILNITETELPVLAGLMKLVPVDGGHGGYVTQAWANDPREQLNPDGSFKEPDF